MSESDFINVLRARFGSTKHEQLVLGIGDDCAVVAGRQLVTTDACIEGTHFRRDFADVTLSDVAYHAAAAATSDIYAMGGKPTLLFSSLMLPEAITDAEFQAICDGMESFLRDAGMALAGGNLSRGPAIGLTTTVLGLSLATPVQRQRANVGDAIFVTGELGDGALAVAAWLSGHAHAVPLACARWKRLPLKQNCAEFIAQHATSAMDLSDGLALDLPKLLGPRIGARINTEQIPRSDEVIRLSQELATADPAQLAITGGEDYELVFTLPASRAAEVPAVVGRQIGIVTPSPDVVFVDGDGQVRALPPQRFTHF